jgi:glutamate carboxypeptidase
MDDSDPTRRPLDTSALRDHLESGLSRHLDVLRRWVSINSYTGNPQGVNELGRLTAETFAALGFAAARVRSARPDVGQHLVLTRPAATASAPTVALVSHLDTVYTADEESANAFGFRHVGDRIYGPGVSDAKGGTLLALMVLDTLAHVAPDVFEAVHWKVGLNAAEEILEPEFSTALLDLLRGRVLAVLVFEPGLDTVGPRPLVVARKGRAQFRIVVAGRGAHAGVDFWKGRNAVIDACGLALALDRLSDRDRDRTVNIGRFSGGTVANRVPHAAEIDGEIRTFDPASLQEALQAIDVALNNLRARGGQATIAISEQVSPWSRNDRTDRLFAIWERAATLAGERVVPQARGGLSDGNFLWHEFPTLDGLGPAGAHFHCSERSDDSSKDQEYAVRSSFVPKAIVTALALGELIATEQTG